MNRLTCFFLGLLMLVACSYDETLDTCRVRVRLVYPEGSIEPYAGALVELKDANASIFVSETNAEGEAAFNVPAGIYETSSESPSVSSPSGGKLLQIVLKEER